MEKRPLDRDTVNILLKYGLHHEKLENPQVVICRKGEYFIEEGYPLDNLYIVLSGKAKVCLNAPNGKNYLLCYFITGGIIGDMELMTGQRTAATTMQAVTDFTCIEIPIAANEESMLKNIEFMNCLAAELANKLDHTSVKSSITVLYPLEQRLCAYIVQTSSEGIFRETLTDVSGLLGCSYRHLLRCLNNLCEKSILFKTNQKTNVNTGYEIIDKARLEELAAELYVLQPFKTRPYALDRYYDFNHSR